MPKSTRSAPPKRLSTGLDSPSARRSSQRPRKTPKRVAFDINTGAIGNGGGEGGINRGGGGGGEPSAPCGPAPGASSTPKETAAARNARKVKELDALRAREEELLRHRQEQARRQREFCEEEERRTREHDAEEERQAREHAAVEEQALRDKEERCALQDRARQERLINDYTYRLIVVLKEVQRNGSARAKWFQRVGTADLKQGKYDNYALDVIVSQGLEQIKIDGEALDYVVVVKFDNRSVTKQRVSIPDSSFEV
jgi:flagellar biosynthesis GTPase FlhF